MTMRCSRCDIAHEETSRCPTDLEYERGYRAGLDQAKITIAEREKHLSAAECSNVSLRQRLAEAEAEIERLRANQITNAMIVAISELHAEMARSAAKGGRDE